MRVIKLALLSFVFLFVLLTAIGLFIPSHIRISKAIDITGNRDSVLHLISNKIEWPRWHPAFQHPKADSIFQANKVTIGPVTKNDSVINVVWLQPGKAPVQNGWQFYTAAAPNTFTVQWYMDFKLAWYPWEKFSSLFYEKTYGLMMDSGLKNLKTLVQPRP